MTRPRWPRGGRRGSADARPRVLLVAMYPLERGLWGATTRITALRDALAAGVELEVISGTRRERIGPILRYLAAGRLRGLAGVYVESSTALPGPLDVALLGLARALGIRVLTYLRDAQQLFDEYYPLTSLKRRASRLLFRPATWALTAASSEVAFPSRGLAAAVRGDGEHATLLPPGARIGARVPIDPAARALLFVGGLRYAAHGGDLLIGAMEMARAEGHDVELICVCRAGEEPAPPYPGWLHIERAEGAEIDRLLPQVRATVTPRRRTPYNDLAVPIKVLEYLGYGRPLLVTDTRETAAIVRQAGCGLVVEDTVGALSAGMARIATAAPEELAAWGDAARQAAEANSWEVRAAQILQLLGIEVATA